MPFLGRRRGSAAGLRRLLLRSSAGVLCGLLLPAVSPATADSEAADGRVIEVITVVAHRQPRTLSEVAGTVTVMDALRLERDVVIDPTDLVRYETGLELDGGGTRFGFGGFRIRGIGGNRSALVIDDVPAADRFSVGNFADSGRGLLQLGLVESVEILRGPASTLYGSKALGGVVALSLLDADDLLKGRDGGGRLSVAAGNDRDRVRLLAAGAKQTAAWRVLAAVAGQEASEVDVPRLPENTEADRQDRRQGALLLRAARELDSGTLRFTFSGMHEDNDTELRALLGSGRFASTTALAGEDRRKQWQLLIDQRLNALGPLDRGHWRAWHQVTDTRQETFEERPLAMVPVDLYRRFDLRQETTGFGADLETGFEALGFGHRLGYGFEIVRSNLEQQRTGLETARETGATSMELLGERFPLRDFPRTRVTELGIYLHDEIRLWRGGPMLSPGVRFEYYELDSRSDELFTAAFPEARVTDLGTTAWTPRLGMVWPLNNQLDVFVQYAEGFRSPPFEDVNIGLDIPRFNVRAIANPDLDPERGRVLESGLRWGSRHTQVELAVFRNDYKDFIETRAALGPDPTTGVLLFQSVNRDRVRIEGLELRARQELGAGFELELSAEWLQGKDRQSGERLAETPPPQAIVALEYAPVERWALRLVTTATRSQKPLFDGQGNPLFSAPGHALVDLLARWSPTPDLRLSMGLFNVADRRVWRNANVSGRPANDPSLPLLAEPGRHVLFRAEWSP